MEYKGKLYGKLGNKYLDTGKTSADWDKTANEIDFLKRQNSWVDKSEDLPPVSEYKSRSIYVLITDGNLIGYGYYNFDFVYWTYYIPGYIEKNGNAITHWMFLPELPQNTK